MSTTVSVEVARPGVRVRRLEPRRLQAELASLADEAVAVFAIQGTRIVQVNEATVRLCGYPRERLISVLPLLLSQESTAVNTAVKDALGFEDCGDWNKAVDVQLTQWRRFA